MGGGCCVGDCCVGDKANCSNYRPGDGSVFDILSTSRVKTTEEKLADREKELSALKNICRVIRSDLHGLMTDVRGFASLAENEFYDKMILTAKNSLNESINDERRQISDLEEKLMRNIFRLGVLQLLSDFLNTENLT